MGIFNNILQEIGAKCKTIVVIAKVKEQVFDFEIFQDRWVPKHLGTSFKSDNTLYKMFKQDAPPKADKIFQQARVDFRNTNVSVWSQDNQDNSFN